MILTKKKNKVKGKYIQETLRVAVRDKRLQRQNFLVVAFSSFHRGAAFSRKKILPLVDLLHFVVAKQLLEV